MPPTPSLARLSTFIHYDTGSLWSVARGLARNVQKYRALLMAADSPRRGDLDGRGALSMEALIEFCEFFLIICIDQVEFMATLLDPEDLLRRMDLHIKEEVQTGRFPKGSFPLLREALLAGEVQRGQAGEITRLRGADGAKCCF
ncbi:MAG: hypothetical protein Q8R88_16550 [Desulfoprunum sp.]|nr:hypothetical protein [Desulfoprunum sp.]